MCSLWILTSIALSLPAFSNAAHSLFQCMVSNLYCDPMPSIKPMQLRMYENNEANKTLDCEFISHNPIT